MALDEKYHFREIEEKWQAQWAEADLYHAEMDPNKLKYYGLEFFPYPSGAGLSVGHFKNYAPTDAFLQLKAMQGYNVLLVERCMPANFFKRAFSRASCPQKRSNSATFCSRAAVGEASVCSLGQNAASPRWSYSYRQRKSSPSVI